MSSTEMISPYAFPGIRVRDLDPSKYPYLFKEYKRLSEEELLEVISSTVGASVENILSKSRISNLVFSRQVFQKVMNIYGNRVTQIAKKMNCDHTTIIHNIRKFDALYEVDENYRAESNKIFSKIGIEIETVRKK